MANKNHKLAFGDTGIVLAALPGGFQPGGAVFMDDNGQPHRKYVKDLARAGEFVKASTGQTIGISADELRVMELSTKAYIANGNKVSLPCGHDTSGNPDKNRGFVNDVFIEGDTLYGVIEAIGKDAIEAASRSHVSIYSPPEWTDGDGHKYDWPIRHVAMTTDPIINKQGKFLPIAASQDGGLAINAELLTPSKKEIIMDFSAIAQRLGITEPITEANAADVIGKAFDLINGKEGGQAQQLALAQDEIKHLKGKLTASVAKELSHNERGMAKRLVESELSNRVKDGNITPAVAAKIGKLLSGSDMMLSFGPTGDPVALQFLDALKDNDVVKLGEQTGRQVVALAQRTQDETEGDAAIESAAKDAQAWAKREFKKNK